MEIELPIDEIVYEDAGRQRQELDSATESTIDELAASFRDVGQINPIVVTRDKRLIAGRRRIEAAKRIGWTHIRAKLWEDLDPLERKIIEYDENARRKQLTWQESANAIAEIHRLKIEKEGSTWSRSDTARALGLSVGKVSEDIDLAVVMDNPRIAGRPTRRGAINTAKREREITLVRELSRRRANKMGVQNEVCSTTFSAGVIYNVDCRSILEKIEADSVDLIVIDPPWGMDFDKSSQWTGKWIPSYDDSPNTVRQMLTEVAPQLRRVLKETCHIYTFFPVQEIEWWVRLLTQAGFIVRQRPLIWYKSGQPGITDVYTSFLPAYEAILWAYKPGQGGLRRLFSRPIPEAQAWPRQPGVWHENEKPVEMLTTWIESSSEVNEVVLDCFTGGGSVLAAAYAVGRYYIGVENDEINYTKCVKRMRELEDSEELIVEEDGEEDV